jgi:hypothetical protein
MKCPALPVGFHRHPSRSISAAVALLWFVASPYFASVASIPKHLPFDHSTKDGSDHLVWLTATLPKQVEAQQPLRLLLTLTNGEITPLLIGESDHWPKMNCRMTLLDEKKAPVPANEKGKMKLEFAAFGSSSLEVSNLAPGAELVWTLDLREVYAIKPGNYTLSIHFDATSSDVKSPYSIKIKDLPFQIRASNSR